MTRAAVGRSVLVGLLASLGLIAFFLAIATLAEGRRGAVEQLELNAPYFAFLLPLFGTQMGLYAHLRLLHAARRRSVAVAAGGNSGLSGVAMVACCAHFLPTLLPYVGITALSTVLAAWRAPLLLVAIAGNAVGVAVIGKHVRRMTRVGGAPPRAGSSKQGQAGPVFSFVDPVCRMPVAPESAFDRVEHAGRAFVFCSAACRDRFRAKPGRFLREAGANAAMAPSSGRPDAQDPPSRGRAARDRVTGR